MSGEVRPPVKRQEGRAPEEEPVLSWHIITTPARETFRQTPPPSGARAPDKPGQAPAALRCAPASGSSFTDWGVTHLKEVRNASISPAVFNDAVLPFGGIAGAFLSGWATDRFFKGSRTPHTAAAAAGSVNFMGRMGAAAGDKVTGSSAEVHGWPAAVRFGPHAPLPAGWSLLSSGKPLPVTSPISNPKFQILDLESRHQHRE